MRVNVIHLDKLWVIKLFRQLSCKLITADIITWAMYRSEIGYPDPRHGSLADYSSGELHIYVRVQQNTIATHSFTFLHKIIEHKLMQDKTTNRINKNEHIL